LEGATRILSGSLKKDSGEMRGKKELEKTGADNWDIKGGCGGFLEPKLFSWC